MGVQETSAQGYEAIKPTLGDRQQLVLKALSAFHRDCRIWPTAYELFGYMVQRHYPHVNDLNDVRPRLTELRDECHAVQTGKKKRTCGRTGRKAFTWEIVTTPRLL